MHCTRPFGNTTPRAVQERLRALGYYDGKLDGALGPVSLGAILRALETAAANVVPPVVAGTLKTSGAGRTAIAKREGNKLRLQGQRGRASLIKRLQSAAKRRSDGLPTGS